MKVRQTTFSDDQRQLTISLANLHAVVGDIEANRHKILHALTHCKEAKVNMAVFPEYCLSGCFWDDPEQCRHYMDQAKLENQTVWLQKNVEPLLDDALQYVVLNVLSHNPNPGKPFLNRTLVVRKGLVYAASQNTYIKTFLPGNENDYCAPGDGRRLILDTRWGRFGLITCYDLNFPPLLHTYAFEDEVDGLIVTAAWRRHAVRAYPGMGIATEDYYAYQWDTMLPAMAAMNQMWMIACNAVGRHPLSDVIFCGKSGLWAPSGINLARCSSDREELLIVHNIDIKGEREREKKDLDSLADFRYFGQSL